MNKWGMIMNKKETQIISNEEYIEMLKPYDEVYAERLKKGIYLNY